ncbi:ester cyclase [Thermosynechococcaceae cyanobacterium BACA0444]|uniref:Ester cyclase n=1 Tax=Pseudocalidococcus azoricus BACA0444 TaxID=2918990 RepID=A0AAE4JZG5_9CYAN|nr:ester cyclase [Pseudocalidococcus azoricus]MDS3860787.1 ester cyclase [Pseudocalidococcus azoricus BACA0444]
MAEHENLLRANTSLVLGFYRAFDERKIDQAIALLSANFTAHLAGIPETLGLPEFQAFGLSFYTAFTQGEHTFTEIVTTEDRVITSGTFCTLHSGPFQGLPATHQRVSIEVMHIDRLENGKIAEHWGQGHALGLLQQLGLIIVPGPKFVSQVIKHKTSNIFSPK